MLKSVWPHPRQHRLGYRLLSAIVLASAGFALLTTAVQLYNQYRNERAIIDEQLVQVERTALESLANSIWTFNETQIRLQLGGLLKLRDVQYVELQIIGGETISAGERRGGRSIERSYELNFHGDKPTALGVLKVSVALEGVYDRLVDHAIAIVIGETAKTFFLALMILFVVTRWVTRHLGHMADYARELSLDRLGHPLTLQRRQRGTPDELDLVAAALNEMSRALAAELERRAIVDAERARLFDAYEHNRFLLQAIIDNTPAIVFIRDVQARYLLVNRRYREVVSTGGTDVVGRTAEEIFPDRFTQILVTDQRVISTNSPIEYEFETPHPDGMHTYLALKFPLRRANGEMFAVGCIATDITERKRAEEQVRYLAQHDALTGLPNRLLLRDRIAQAIAQSRRAGTQVGVMFIDLDYFKHINDSLGHESGDRLLEAMAVRLRACLREGDTVARLGGDEFVVSLPDLKESHDAIPIAEKVLEALREPVLVGSELLHASGSVGISLYPADGDDAEALMRSADAAMYHAKERGRDNYQFFTPRVNEAAQRRHGVATRLRQGMLRDEFEMHFQPQVDLETGRVFAAEALIRWHHDGEIITPTEFIHIAEETGLIVSLGEWALRESCAQAARWRAAGHSRLSMAVNLSPQQLLREGFAELTRRVLGETGLPPSSLEMEITESMLMMRSPENIAMLERLAGMGIRLAIDDFGTGYSSLAYLQRFPIKVVKIDQSFIAGIGDDANATAIVTAIIAMAHSLRLKVVAEGVETARQVTFLKAHGCLAAQGHYFSPAVPAAQFVGLLDRPLWPKMDHPADNLAPPSAWGQHGD